MCFKQMHRGQAQIAGHTAEGQYFVVIHLLAADLTTEALISK